MSIKHGVAAFGSIPPHVFAIQMHSTKPITFCFFHLCFAMSASTPSALLHHCNIFCPKNFRCGWMPFVHHKLPPTTHLDLLCCHSSSSTGTVFHTEILAMNPSLNCRYRCATKLDRCGRWGMSHWPSKFHGLHHLLLFTTQQGASKLIDRVCHPDLVPSHSFTPP